MSQEVAEQSSHEPPSSEEIERRKQVLERIRTLRAELPPLEVPAAELVKQARRNRFQGSLD